MATISGGGSFNTAANYVAIGGEASKGGSYYDTTANLAKELLPESRPALQLIQGGAATTASPARPTAQPARRISFGSGLRAAAAKVQPPSARPRSRFGTAMFRAAAARRGMAVKAPGGVPWLLIAGAGAIAWLTLR